MFHKSAQRMNDLCGKKSAVYRQRIGSELGGRKERAQVEYKRISITSCKRFFPFAARKPLFYRNTPILASGIKCILVQLILVSMHRGSSFMRRRLRMTRSLLPGCAAAVSLSIKVFFRARLLPLSERRLILFSSTSRQWFPSYQSAAL